jgi:hypothetical protein
MAKIIIRKGFISHGGRLFMAGDVIDIADAAYAKRMVARSGGDFDFYHSGEIPARDEAPTIISADAGSGAEAGEAGELPAIDADADMQPKGKKK